MGTTIETITVTRPMKVSASFTNKFETYRDRLIHGPQVVRIV